MTARLLEPAPHVDRQYHAGAVIADHAIGAIRADASDPDVLMRTLLRVVADAGFVIAPTSLLRGVCARLQDVLREAGHATTE